jgi:hypothetical protein
MARSAQVDFIFTGWFCVEAILMLYILIKRLTLDGPAGYGDLVAFMVILYGFMLPGALYLLYTLIVLGTNWYCESGISKAWATTFANPWAVRSRLAFGCALLINALYLLPRPW